MVIDNCSHCVHYLLTIGGVDEYNSINKTDYNETHWQHYQQCEKLSSSLIGIQVGLTRK